MTRTKGTGEERARPGAPIGKEDVMGRVKEQSRGRLAVLQDILTGGGKALVDQAQSLGAGVQRRLAEVGRGVESQVSTLITALEERLSERLDLLLDRLAVSLRRDLDRVRERLRAVENRLADVPKEGVRELVAPLQAIASGAAERASAALARIEELSLRLQHTERRIAELTRETTRETLDASASFGWRSAVGPRQRPGRSTSPSARPSRSRISPQVEIVPVPQLADNYAYLLIDPASREAAVVDCAEAAAILAEAERRGARLTAVLATHHHFDHVGGNPDLLAALPGLRVYGSADDAPHIPGITHRVRDGDPVQVGPLQGRAIMIPAHTSGHVAYHFPSVRAVFTGDTLFAAGCGRLFEGDAAQMVASLAKLAALPDDTRVYCGHEYTEKNLRFAAMLEPGNRTLAAKLAAVQALRGEGKFTVPSTIGEEKATNPFLRIDSPELAASVRARISDLPPGDPVALFAAVRALKDRF